MLNNDILTMYFNLKSCMERLPMLTEAGFGFGKELKEDARKVVV